MAHNDSYLLFLITQAKEGNKNKYLEFCELYYDEIFKAIYRFLPNEELACDITTDVFISAYDSLKYVQEDTPFTDWLKSIAIRNSLNLLKTLESEVDFSLSDHNQKYLESLSSEFKDVLEQFLKLPAKLRISYVLHTFDGYNEKEIISLVKEIFDNEDKNILTEAYSALVKDTNYLLVADSEKGWKNVSKFKSELPEELEQTFELINDLKDRFNIYFRRIDSSAEIITDIKNALLESSIKKAEDEKQKRAKIREQRVQKAKNETREKSALKLKPVPKAKPSKKKKEKPVKIKIYKRPQWINPAIVVVTIIAFYFTFLMPKSEPSWLVDKVEGDVQIEGKPFDKSEIVESKTYSTKENSSMELSKNTLGNLKLEENTSIKIKKNKYNESSIQFLQGKLEVSSLHKSYNRHDIIELPQGYIVDKGADYIIELNELGNGRLRVKDGYLIVKYQDKEFLLTTESSAQILTNEIGVPVHEKTSRKIKSAVSSFNLDKRGDYLITLFEKEFNKYSGITVWNLYNATKGENKEKLFNLLKTNFIIPTQITSYNDEKNYQLLRDEISWQLY